MEPQGGLSYNARGLLLERLGRSDQAIHDFDMATSLDAANTSYLKNRGLCYRTLGQYDAAIRDFTRWGWVLKPGCGASDSLRGRGLTSSRVYGQMAHASRLQAEHPAKCDERGWQNAASAAH